MLAVLDLLAVAFFLTPAADGGYVTDENHAKQFLDIYDRYDIAIYSPLAAKSYQNMVNPAKAEDLTEAVEEYLDLAKYCRTYASEFNTSKMTFDTQRRINKIRKIGIAAMENKTYFIKTMEENKDAMYEIYSSAKVCVTPDNCLHAEPGLAQIMATSRNHTELLHIWVAWRNKTGRLVLDRFRQYVKDSNEAVKPLGFKNYAEYLLDRFEQTGVISEMAKLYHNVKHLYQNLHTYVRIRLERFYKGYWTFPTEGHMPAHLLGDMWAQEWDNIYNLVVPFSHVQMLDITPALVAQKYTGRKIFKTAEDFFVSLGFDPLPESFWNESVFEKPTDGREIPCGPMAFDFGDGKNFRVIMCTEITQKHFLAAHQQVGYIMYMTQYKDQPRIYREGASDAIHAALGEFIALSVMSPIHLHKLGLINRIPTDPDYDINYLLKMAMKYVAFLPYGYVLSRWRWDTFRDIDTRFINSHYWKLRFFFSNILMFHFHAVACGQAHHNGPLHTCDIYNNKEVGRKLRSMLRLGSSVHWTDALRQFTGVRSFSANGLLRYFEPLTKFLQDRNYKTRHWSGVCPKLFHVA